MTDQLTAQELVQLVQRVFQPSDQDRGLAIMVDLPDEKLADNPDWEQRRNLAAGWYRELLPALPGLGLSRLTLAWYRNAGGNNADLPPECYPGDGSTVPRLFQEVSSWKTWTFDRLFGEHSLVLAPTELSATAPLKVATAKSIKSGTGFRAATMPGFLPSMVPALRLDYAEINRRVNLLKDLLDQAERAELHFQTAGQDHFLALDLRFNPAHASGGLFPVNGVAGNLPSGEAYIVPYEGNRPGQASLSQGTLPVQLGDEVVIYRIEGNKAVEVLSAGPASSTESERIVKEPAYANLAELGLGVLGDFGLKPTGSILLDEKLGLHIAFGRSDHFGGSVGPQDFSSPEAVIHLDQVYIPETQPQVTVKEVRLLGPGLERRIISAGILEKL